LGSVHLLTAAASAGITNEQRLRGTDGTVDSALVVTAHDEKALAVAEGELLSGLLEHGAANITRAVYAIHYSLSSAEHDA
jgi:hypothetical protein